MLVVSRIWTLWPSHFFQGAAVWSCCWGRGTGSGLVMLPSDEDHRGGRHPILISMVNTQDNNAAQMVFMGSLYVRFMTCTWKVGCSSPGVATVRYVPLLGPLARPLTPHSSTGDCPLLRLINCKSSLWIIVEAKLQRIVIDLNPFDFAV